MRIMTRNICSHFWNKLFQLSQFLGKTKKRINIIALNFHHELSLMISSAQKKKKRELVGRLGSIRVIRFSSFERNENNDKKYLFPFLEQIIPIIPISFKDKEAARREYPYKCAMP